MASSVVQPLTWICGWPGRAGRSNFFPVQEVWTTCQG